MPFNLKKAVCDVNDSTEGLRHMHGAKHVQPVVSDTVGGWGIGAAVFSERT